jgi:hypothetical protein
MVEKEEDRTLKGLAELFYQQYMRDLKNGEIKSLKIVITGTSQ